MQYLVSSYSLHSLLLRRHKKAYHANSSLQLWPSHAMSALCFLPKPTSLSCSLSRTHILAHSWLLLAHIHPSVRRLDIDVLLRIRSPDPNCFQTKYPISNMLVVFQTRPRTVRSIVVYIFTRHIDRHQRGQIVRRDMPAWSIIKDYIRRGNYSHLHSVSPSYSPLCMIIA